jgi:hypothetical protein
MPEPRFNFHLMDQHSMILPHSMHRTRRTLSQLHTARMIRARTAPPSMASFPVGKRIIGKRTIKRAVSKQPSMPASGRAARLRRRQILARLLKQELMEQELMEQEFQQEFQRDQG